MKLRFIYALLALVTIFHFVPADAQNKKTTKKTPAKTAAKKPAPKAKAPAKKPEVKAKAPAKKTAAQDTTKKIVIRKPSSV